MSYQSFLSGKTQNGSRSGFKPNFMPDYLFDFLRGGMTQEEYEAEIARLHDFILQVANRLAIASEVLGALAERKERRNADRKQEASKRICQGDAM